MTFDVENAREVVSVNNDCPISPLTKFQGILLVKACDEIDSLRSQLALAEKVAVAADRHDRRADPDATWGAIERELEAWRASKAKETT